MAQNCVTVNNCVTGVKHLRMQYPVWPYRKLALGCCAIIVNTHFWGKSIPSANVPQCGMRATQCATQDRPNSTVSLIGSCLKPQVILSQE